ncbi:coiled-coil domain-containing protein 115-like [Portunus trituberculatus]|uniref:coiled-coil domain-containing protein 115-like n=1 Tax=Portunus trituberculatus TaxID=210409 RepID=UPI001E1D1158|nr:coiled-coil domain-containing protein 115-like [Portunus trituberculatus]XP_045136907.1 coiled-coil domain-containing protein 115-like [Portunus trituberculatus]XP_045136908.1 coiled-coil domain-containing protein 115-like [Portunus trituberculatus]XP_045136909.1 coiled-coil domain-containing protein 115-like [Portunus trituberculatus]
MAGSIQLSREALCDGLDHLALQQLRLMDHLIRCNMMLEEKMRSGYFLLSKTRYSMGTNAVSSLQLPSPDSETESLANVVTSPVFLEEYKGDIMYHTVDVNFKDPMTPLPEEEEEEIFETQKSKKKGTRKRQTADKKEQMTDCDNSILENDSEKKTSKKSNRKSVNRDPIRWFSALPQQSLRQAQQDFKSSISLIAECATIQSKLRTINKEYSRLQEIKNKVDGGEKEE